MPARQFTQPHWESDLASPRKTKATKHVGFFCIFKPDPVPVLGHMRIVRLCQNNQCACVHRVETGDVNSSRKNTVKASSPCQGQIYLGLEEFLNEQVKPIHVSLSGEKATSHALPYCASNRHFQGVNKSHHVPKTLAPCHCQCLLSLDCGRESPTECKT